VSLRPHFFEEGNKGVGLAVKVLEGYSFGGVFWFMRDLEVL
jgi:hypothetical protein